MKTLDAISQKALNPEVKTDKSDTVELYDIAMNRLDGTVLDLSEYKGKHLLFVNVASKCGFTGQYKDLERLYQKYKTQLMVIGVPSNQFGAQEPGTAEEIQSFCALNYGVSFVMTEKVMVKGPNQHPLYQWLTKKALNGKQNSSVKWNFQKYLVNPEGKLIDFFYSITSPSSSKITKHLKA